MFSPKALRDWSLLLVCNLIWGSYFVWVKLVQREMGPIFATFLPMTIATLLLIPVARRDRHSGARPRRGDMGAFILIGVCGQVAAQLFGTWGGRLSPAANASLLMLTLPVATAVIAYLVLRERMNTVRWISFILAVAGVLQCSDIDWSALRFRGEGLAVANLMLFLSVLGSAFYNVYSKLLLVRYSPLQVLLYSYYVVCACLLPAALWQEPEGFRNLTHYGASVWLGLGVLAVLQYGVSMIIFLTVLSRIDAGQAALSNYLIPFFGVLIAAMALGERLTVPMMAGGALVLASTVLATAWGDEPQERG